MGSRRAHSQQPKAPPSEDNLGGELQIAAICFRSRAPVAGRDERGRQSVGVDALDIEISVIEEVIGLTAKLHAHPFGESERLIHSKVQVPVTRRAKRIAARWE